MIWSPIVFAVIFLGALILLGMQYKLYHERMMGIASLLAALGFICEVVAAVGIAWDGGK